MSGWSMRPLGLGDRLYRLALLVLPKTFRAVYAEEIISYHHTRMAEVTGANWARLIVWTSAVWDVVLHGAFERGTRVRRHISQMVRAARKVSSGRSSAQEPHSQGAPRGRGPWVWFDSHAFRRLRKSPRFTIVTILTLGLGIGANTALFSVVYSVLLSPLPYENSERLVFAWETRDQGGRRTSVSLGNFEAWRRTSTEIRPMAAARYRPFNVTGGDRPYREDGLEMSAGLITMLGARPAFGREFTEADERPGAEPVCVVSYAFWVERLQSNQYLSKLALTLNGTAYTVVGVLPENFVIPSLGPQPIVTPLQLDLNDPGYWTNHNARVIGRLAEGIDLERATQELQAIASRLKEAHNDVNEGIGAQLVPARDQVVRGSKTAIWVLFGTVALVLLIACVNVASLLLARATAAERELAVRAAIGASQSRIVSLILSEALLLSLMGGLVGLGIGYFGVETIRSWSPTNLPRLNEVSVSIPVLLFTLACAVSTGLLFGLAPAIRSSRVDIQTTLNKSGRSPGLESNQHMQRAFVVVEVVIAVVLLNCAGLLLRTFNNLLNVHPGFDMEGRVALQVSLPGAHYSEYARVTRFLDQLHEKLNAIPGVRSSGSSVGLPFHWMMFRQYMTLEGRPAATIPEIPVVDLSISTPGYLETMDITLLGGRSISASDDANSPFVAVVNEAFVRENLPDQDPMGRRLRFSQPDALLPGDSDPRDIPWYAIVGVVQDVKRWNLTSEAVPEVFIPQSQHDWAREFFVVVHTTLPVEAVADQMRQAVWDVDPEQPVASVQAVEDLYSNMIAQPRVNAALVGAFGLTALTLALIGVYGLMANAVSSRTREIGVRVALGAAPGQILKHVAGQGIAAAALGIMIGTVGSAAASRVLRTLLFGVDPLDMPTFMFVLTSVLIVAVAAAAVPSWRAAKLDATEALAAE